MALGWLGPTADVGLQTVGPVSDDRFGAIGGPGGAVSVVAVAAPTVAVELAQHRNNRSDLRVSGLSAKRKPDRSSSPIPRLPHPGCNTVVSTTT